MLMKCSKYVESAFGCLYESLLTSFDDVDWRNEARYIGSAILLTGIMSVDIFNTILL